MEDDPFDSLLRIEEQYYKEGYDLGVKDGSHAGLIEGRLFGLEKGFEKYVTIGTLHGRSVLWSGRLRRARRGISGDGMSEASTMLKDRQSPGHEFAWECKPPNQEEHTLTTPGTIPQIPNNTRLEKHIRILYALTELSSLSTENSEESVSAFDDRLKRADGKVKIIEKILDESSSDKLTTTEPERQTGLVNKHNFKVDGSIEDSSTFPAGH